MCGKRLKHFLSLSIILFASIALLSASPSVQSVDTSSPLDELLVILSDYEMITMSLSDRLQDSELGLNQLQTSTNRISTSLSNLEQNYSKLNNILITSDGELSKMEVMLKASNKQIDNLEIGYANMETKLKLSKIFGTVNIVISVSIGVALFIVLTKQKG